MLIFTYVKQHRCLLACGMSHKVLSNTRNALGALPKSLQNFSETLWIMLGDILEPWRCTQSL